MPSCDTLQSFFGKKTQQVDFQVKLNTGQKRSKNVSYESMTVTKCSNLLYEVHVDLPELFLHRSVVHFHLLHCLHLRNVK